MSTPENCDEKGKPTALCVKCNGLMVPID
jgi:hypothetical protein